MKYYECLPSSIGYYVATLRNVRELRIRNGKAVKINVDGKWYFIGNNILTQNSAQAIAVGDVCDEIVNTACNNSIYAYEKMLAQGYFTLEDGCRVGVSGRMASGGGVFQHYTSLCFRIPHCVNCVDERTLSELRGCNVIVIGPPNSGKTTFLRDYASQLSLSENVLVVDERGELFFDNAANQASNCDVIRWSTKQYAFEAGVRSMSPDVIVCDEICEADAHYISSVASSGVVLACSSHGYTFEDFLKRFPSCVDCFDKAVILDKSLKYFVKVLNTSRNYIEN